MKNLTFLILFSFFSVQVLYPNSDMSDLSKSCEFHCDKIKQFKIDILETLKDGFNQIENFKFTELKCFKKELAKELDAFSTDLMNVVHGKEGDSEELLELKALCSSNRQQHRINILENISDLFCDVNNFNQQELEKLGKEITEAFKEREQYNLLKREVKSSFKYPSFCDNDLLYKKQKKSEPLAKKIYKNFRNMLSEEKSVLFDSSCDNGEEITFLCLSCGATRKDMREALYHFMDKHVWGDFMGSLVPEVPDWEQDTVNYKCEFCGKCFGSKCSDKNSAPGLRDHVKKHLREIKQTSVTEFFSEEDDARKAISKKLKCLSLEQSVLVLAIFFIKKVVPVSIVDSDMEWVGGFLEYF